MVTTLNLLSGLRRFSNLANAIAKEASVEASYAISLSYNTITITLDKTKGDAKEQWAELTLEIKGATAAVTNISAASPENKNTITNFISTQAESGQFAWEVEIKQAIYPQEIEGYVTIADAIAKEVYLFDSGDDYRPGYFTEIIAASDAIALKQTNWRNARSSDHKDDYFMRELKFFIPLTTNKTNRFMSVLDEPENIGAMKVSLSDRSSKQNRQGGALIRQKIDQLKSGFGARH